PRHIADSIGHVVARTHDVVLPPVETTLHSILLAGGDMARANPVLDLVDGVADALPSRLDVPPQLVRFHVVCSQLVCSLIHCLSFSSSVMVWLGVRSAWSISFLPLTPSTAAAIAHATPTIRKAIQVSISSARPQAKANESSTAAIQPAKPAPPNRPAPLPACLT